MLRNPRSEGGGRCIKRNRDTTMPWEGRTGPCGALHESTAQPRAVPSLGGRADALWVLGSGQTQSSGPIGLSADHGSVSAPRPTSPPLLVPCLPSPWRGPSISNPSACQNCSLLACPGRPTLCSYPGQPQELGPLHLGSWQLRLAPALSCSSWCGPGAVAPWELVLEKQEFGRCPRQTG